MATLIDTHAHLFGRGLDQELPQVIQRAKTAGVVQMIAVGITADTSAACIRMAQKHPEIFATVGLHPNEISRARANEWDEVVQLAETPGVVAIGETGLDRYRDHTPFAVQEDYFARHLELGRKKNLPVVIHCREAAADVVRMLRTAFDKHGPIKGVLHSFCEDEATGEAVRAMGLHVSFAGMLTYDTAADLRAVAAKQPLDRVLVETDCPYLSPVPVRGRRNEPAHTAHTAACLAGLHGVSVEELGERTTANARRLFGLPGN